MKNIESLMFAVNEKANSAAKSQTEAKTDELKQFYFGQYMAYSEIYTMLLNEKNRPV